jgi:parvulin-like peptidyl-prolyl isomerase
MIFFVLISVFSFSNKGKPVAIIANRKVFEEDIPKHLTLEQHLQNLIFYELAKEKGYDDSVKTRIDRNFNQQIIRTAMNSYMKNFSNPSIYERIAYYKLSRKSLNIQMIQTQSFTEALQAYTAVKSGKDFGEASQEYSYNPEIKHAKGVYPYPLRLTPKTPPPFIKLFKMNKGEISLPIKNGPTWNIFKITDIKYHNEEESFNKESMLSEIKNPAFKRETASYNATIKQNKMLGKFIPWVADIKFSSKNISFLLKKVSKLEKNPIPVKSAFADEDLEMVLAESAVGEYKISNLLTDLLEMGRLSVLQSEVAIKDFIKRQIWNNIVIAIFKRTGVQREFSMEDKHKMALQDATIDFFKNKEMLSMIKGTEEDLRDFYKKNPDKYVVAEKRKVYLIEVKEENEAIGIRNKLISGENFETTAKEVSIGRKKKKGGEIGYIKENQYGNIGLVAFELVKGQISKPFETENGWAIIKVTDIKKSYKQDYKDVKAAIQNDYKVYKAQQIGNQIYEQNKEKYKLKILS